jgi:hypothetical protein
MGDTTPSSPAREPKNTETNRAAQRPVQRLVMLPLLRSNELLALKRVVDHEYSDTSTRITNYTIKTASAA